MAHAEPDEILFVILRPIAASIQPHIANRSKKLMIVTKRALLSEGKSIPRFAWISPRWLFIMSISSADLKISTITFATVDTKAGGSEEYTHTDSP